MEECGCDQTLMVAFFKHISLLGGSGCSHLMVLGGSGW